MEKVPENDGFVEDEEDDEVDIDDEFEEIEEDFDDNNESGFKWIRGPLPSIYIKVINNRPCADDHPLRNQSKG